MTVSRLLQNVEKYGWGIELLTFNNDLPLPFSSFPKTHTALAASWVYSDIFGQMTVSRLLQNVEKYGWGIELLYSFS